VDKVALGQVFFEYFGFPCQSSFHKLLHNHPHLSSGAGKIGQMWPQYKELSSTPLAIKKIPALPFPTTAQAIINIVWVAVVGQCVQPKYDKSVSHSRYNCSS
jgi:hypothetical protein